MGQTRLQVTAPTIKDYFRKPWPKKWHAWLRAELQRLVSCKLTIYEYPVRTSWPNGDFDRWLSFGNGPLDIAARQIPREWPKS